MENSNENSKIDWKYNFSTYLKFLSKYKLVAFLVVVFVCIQEFYSVFTRYLFKLIIDKGTLFSSGELLKEPFTGILFAVAVAFAIATLLNVIASFFKNHFLTVLELGMMKDVKKKYVDYLVSLDHNFHVTHKTGGMISRISRGNTAIERITDIFIFNFVSLFIQIIFIFFSLYYLDVTSSIIVTGVVVIFLIYSIVLQRLQEKYNVIANKKEDVEKGNISDIFTNIDSIQYFGKEKSIREKYEKLAEDTRKSAFDNWNFFKWMAAGQNLILGIGTFLIIYFPLVSFLEGNMTLGTLTFIYTTFASLVNYLYGFIFGVRGFYRSMADFQDLFAYGKIEKEVKDKPNSKKLIIKNGDIEFNKVNFNYGKRKIFEDFNLKIPRNKKIALVGHSGSGKTTLVKLLYRMYDINEGEIKVDGNDIRDLKQESLRSEMSIVPQECVLFDDTIYNNVAFSKPNASKEEVMEAIRFAQLDKIIKSFPDKENTIVGERGVKLSGGEKQRVSIARAILANKKILVLDEATSSLDSQTEHEIQTDLEKLMKGRTSIIIAHRLSTIMKADTIVVMKNGKIVQKGNHLQLIDEQGEYRNLWNLQKGGYIK